MSSKFAPQSKRRTICSVSFLLQFSSIFHMALSNILESLADVLDWLRYMLQQLCSVSIMFSGSLFDGS